MRNEIRKKRRIRIKEGRKEGRKERKKEGRKEGRIGQR